MYALIGWNSPVAPVAPEIEIRYELKVECQSVMCGYSEFASTHDIAIELRRQHIEWHEDGCPRL